MDILTNYNGYKCVDDIKNSFTKEEIATGIIETPVNTLPGVLFDFISKVPTDYDMVINFEETKSNRRGI